jgi:hypothetical protein
MMVSRLEIQRESVCLPQTQEFEAVDGSAHGKVSLVENRARRKMDRSHLLTQGAL